LKDEEGVTLAEFEGRFTNDTSFSYAGVDDDGSRVSVTTGLAGEERRLAVELFQSAFKGTDVIERKPRVEGIVMIAGSASDSMYTVVARGGGAMRSCLVLCDKRNPPVSAAASHKSNDGRRLGCL
jgi:hypothetical protein